MRSRGINKIFLIGSIVVLLLLCGFVCAQQVVISTYYPFPYGLFNVVRVANDIVFPVAYDSNDSNYYLRLNYNRAPDPSNPIYSAKLSILQVARGVGLYRYYDKDNTNYYANFPLDYRKSVIQARNMVVERTIVMRGVGWHHRRGVWWLERGDIAEPFKFKTKPSVGDVVIVSSEGAACSRGLADGPVIGVVSAVSSIYLGGGNKTEDNTMSVGVSGVVVCNISDEGGKLEAGDILITASKPGHAMKAPAGKICSRKIVGKFIRRLDETKALIFLDVN